METRKLKIDEALEVITSTITQFYDDRMFETYKLGNMLNDKPISYSEFKGNLIKKTTIHNKPTDLNKINKNTDRILNNFVKERR